MCGLYGSRYDYLNEAIEGAESMASKEENVPVPLSLEHLTATQWTQIAAEENEFGHAFGVNLLHVRRSFELQTTSLKRRKPQAAMDENNAGAVEEAISAYGKVKLSTGEFTIPQLEATIPLTLPLLTLMTRHVTSANGDTRASLVLAAWPHVHMTAIHQRAKRLFVASSPSLERS